MWHALIVGEGGGAGCFRGTIAVYGNDCRHKNENSATTYSHSFQEFHQKGIDYHLFVTTPDVLTLRS